MVTSTIVEATAVEAAVQRYAAVADATRLRVLAVLSTGQCCACDVQAAVDVAPNLLSYHLRVLREANLIAGTRRGRWIDYQIAPDAAGFVADVLTTAGFATVPGCAPSSVCPPGGHLR